MFPAAPRDLPVYFHALANPTRLRIVERLAEVGETSVNDIALHLRMSQPRVSWHLRMLRAGGVVTRRRDGRQIYCSLDREAIHSRQEALRELIGPSTEGVKP